MLWSKLGHCALFHMSASEPRLDQSTGREFTRAMSAAARLLIYPVGIYDFDLDFISPGKHNLNPQA